MNTLIIAVSVFLVGILLLALMFWWKTRALAELGVAELKKEEPSLLRMMFGRLYHYLTLLFKVVQRRIGPHLYRFYKKIVTFLRETLDGIIRRLLRIRNHLDGRPNHPRQGERSVFLRDLAVSEKRETRGVIHD
jgi:hypothetical protein